MASLFVHTASLLFFCFLFISLFSSFFFFSPVGWRFCGIENRQRALTLDLIQRKNSVWKLISVNLDTIQFGWKRDTVSKMHRD